LNGTHISTLLEQVNGKCVSKRMGSNGFGNVTALVCLLAHTFYSIRADVSPCNLPSKQPQLGPFLSPPIAENFQQLGRAHVVAIFLPLALLNPNHHPSAINVGNLQSNGFRDPQTCRIATGQDGAVMVLSYTAQKLQYLLRAEDYGELLRRLGGRNDVLKFPLS